MRTENLVESHNRLVIHRNRLWGALGVLSVLNLLLVSSVFCLIGRERVVVVPPMVSRDFWISTDNVSESYLEQMAEFFAGLLLNVTPNSFATRAEHLLQHVDTEAYPALKAKLVEQQMEIERRAMSTSFHPTSFKVDKNHLLVELKGELKILIGNASLESQSKTYQIKFIQRHGRLYIQQFSEVSHV